jgi:propanol-preferring alcohol dehydrogenase
VMGHETCGTVVSAGPDAGPLDAERTYVVYPWIGCGTCDSCAEGRENYCGAPRYIGIHVDGGYATHVRVPHPRYLFDIGGMDPRDAAPLACSGLTVYAAIGKLQADPARDPVVIIGAGGLGLMCLGILTALGGKPAVVVEIDPAKREAARIAGAGAAIDPTDPDALAQITAAVGRAPMSVIDFVGAEATAKLGFDVLGKGGQIVMVGLFGGGAPWDLPMIPIKCATITGSYVGSLTEFAALMELARKGRIPKIPIRDFALDGANAALHDLEGGQIVGRAILVP